MNYNIKGTSLDITDELRSYTERQLAHADKLVDDTTAHADIELAHLPEGRSGKYRAEFTVSVGGKVHRAEAWGGTLHEAIDLAGAELVAELRKVKSKKMRMFRHSALRVKEYLRGWRNKV
ncbi:MAG: ribosome-associated translation inhibitor RaiA [Patescibacteria group bacterium]